MRRHSTDAAPAATPPEDRVEAAQNDAYQQRDVPHVASSTGLRLRRRDRRYWVAIGLVELNHGRVNMTEICDTAVMKAAGVGPDHPLLSVLAGRSDIMTMTDRAQDAALVPRNPGGLSHGVRAAMACRIARLNAAPELASHFSALMRAAGASETVARVADPEFDGGDDTRLRAMIRHVDLVTRDPKGAGPSDIAALTEADISEDDIVRLSELVAFVNYQARVAVALRLLGASP